MTEDTPQSSPREYGFATVAIHAGSHPDPATNAVIAPIGVSTTFAQSEIGTSKYEYSRSGNDSRERFETALAALEGGKYGLAFSSGSAVTAAILDSLRGGHIVSSHDVYGGTHRYMTKVAYHKGLQTTFANLSDPETLRGLIREDTKAVWVESPSNPTLSLVDISEISRIAKEINHNIILVVDNTFLSPYISNPLALGADIVFHSVTKYINGHSDVVMGALATNSESLYESLKFLQNANGAVPSPFDCFLAHRGLKTLALRSKAASDNALAIATYLASSPYVGAVSYPGLQSHPQHRLTYKQHRVDASGHPLSGGMISFRIKGGPLAAEQFCYSTKLFTLAESLGGVESLLEIPARMTHSGLTEEERLRAGVFPDLIRLSVGIEEKDDLISDIEQAFEKVLPALVELQKEDQEVDSGIGSETSSVIITDA
jgi:cystathionine gamma-lyase